MSHLMVSVNQCKLIISHSFVKFAAIIEIQLHEQNDEISNPLNLSKIHFQKISGTF